MVCFHHGIATYSPTIGAMQSQTRHIVAEMAGSGSSAACQVIGDIREGTTTFVVSKHFPEVERGANSGLSWQMLQADATCDSFVMAS